MPTIIEATASIFSAPAHSILLHACNAKGSWGAGVAAAFKSHYPAAYKVYNAHCLPSRANANCILRSHQQSLVGTTLLIPPQSGDQNQHWIACLFTSHGFGRAVAKPDEILKATKAALADLERQIEGLRARGKEDLGECWAVRINSGKFGVEWAKSRRVLEEGGLDITVVRREEDEDALDGAGATAAGDDNGEKRADVKPSGEKRKRGRIGKDEVVAKREKKGAGCGGGTIDGWLKPR